MRLGITVVTPTIPPRARLLNRAMDSLRLQTLRPRDVIIQGDADHSGAAATRQRGLEAVDTEWVAFLDDDDEFMPGHLEALWAAHRSTEADMIYSWYEVIGGTDPRPEEFGLPWDKANPRQTTIVSLVRTELALDVGGFVDLEEDADLDSPDRHYAGEDWRFTRRINASGMIYHLPVKTWYWHHHGANTSGLGSRW
jgi:glycosyltransferase involved in cell wall biosynthesis